MSFALSKTIYAHKAWPLTLRPDTKAFVESFPAAIPYVKTSVISGCFEQHSSAQEAAALGEQRLTPTQ